MTRFAAILLTICLFAANAPAQSPALPEDGGQYNLITITLQTPTQYGAELLRAMDSDPELQAIANLCHVHRWTPATKVYQLRYAQSLPPTTLPIVALTRDDGGVIYKASGPEVPREGPQLAKVLREAAAMDQSMQPRQATAANCPRCPQTPASPVMPNFRPLDRVIPDTVTLTAPVNFPAVPTWVFATFAFLAFLTVCGGLACVAIVGAAAFFFLRK